MKNTLLRQELLNRGTRMYELAHAIGIADASLSRWLRTEWPESLQKEALSCLDNDSKDYRRTIKYKISHFVSASNTDSYVSRVMRDVEEKELKREKEREGWY